jgi:cellobiose-specific phosphotransferase system component IIA
MHGVDQLREAIMTAITAAGIPRSSVIAALAMATEGLLVNEEAALVALGQNAQ